MNQKQSEIIKLLHIREFLQDYEDKLKGFAFDPKKQMMIRKTDPLVSDDGVEKLMSLLNVHCNNVLTMGSFDINNIADIKFKAQVALIEFFYYNNSKYSIKKSDFNLIYTSALALILSCLSRAQSTGGLSDKSFLMTTNQRMESNVQYNAGQMGGSGYSGGYGGRRGWAGKVLGFFRGGGSDNG